MNLKTHILLFVILLASGGYFTHRTNRLPRIEVKGYVDLGKPGKLTERNWMEDPSKEYTLDLNATEYFRTIFSHPGIHITENSEAGLIHARQPDPLLLDRPPPIQA